MSKVTLALRQLFHAPIQRWGGTGVQISLPLENHKAIGFLSNTGLDPSTRKSQNYHASIQCWAIIDAPGGPMTTRFKWCLNTLSPKLKITWSELSWIKLSGSPLVIVANGRICLPYLKTIFSKISHNFTRAS